MVNITVSADCGNSPRKLFLKDFHIALAKGETDFVLKNVDDNISWEFVGDRTVEGKAAFQKALTKLMSDKVKALTVTHVITHGYDAAVKGERTMEDGKTYSFCDIYSFKGAKGNTIGSISSYVIEVE